jgi:hypothetical protein
MVARAFPGTVVLKWAVWGAGWTDNHPLGVCIECGVGTVQRDPTGQPNHFRHYQDDGKPVTT